MKRWKCAYCKNTYASLGKWFREHFIKKHPDQMNKAVDITSYEVQPDTTVRKTKPEIRLSGVEKNGND